MVINEFAVEPGEVTVQWVVNAFANDLSTAADIQAAEEYNRHGILAITVTASIASGTKWFKILDGSDVMLGPCALVSGVPYEVVFDRPIYGTVGNALKGQTSTNIPICFVIEGVTGTLPEKATNPSPADEATGVNINPSLSWDAEPTVTLHNVYFGTTTPPPAETTLSSSGYSPGALDVATTYYWRIDVSDGNNVATGDVWSFTTA